MLSLQCVERRPIGRLSFYGQENIFCNTALNNQPQQNISPTKISLDQHQINENEIYEHAKFVVNKLLKANYQAYLVGGCVRDLLLGITPKDFDVATNARPEQICKLFKHSRLIGRRFQIVHVYFEREFIEVSTFRAIADQSQQNTTTEYDNGQLVRDNTFGTIEEDAQRRDFSVNALYYDLEHAEVLDFCNGIKDIDAKILRIIGHPETRYKEDPVRILRALRFRAKLNLEIEEETSNAIKPLGYLLLDISKARLFDEVIKLFHSGYAANCFYELEHYDLLKRIFPAAAHTLKNDEQFRNFINFAIDNTDSRINIGKSVNPAFIFAVLLWRSYTQQLQHCIKDDMPRYESLWEAGRLTVANQSMITAIPKRFLIAICEIWKLQDRFQRVRGKKIFQLLGHPRFRAAYDFMCLRAQAGELELSEAEWWTQIQEVPENEQRKLVNERTKNMDKQNKRQRKH